MEFGDTASIPLEYTGESGKKYKIVSIDVSGDITMGIANVCVIYKRPWNATAEMVLNDFCSCEYSLPSETKVIRSFIGWADSKCKTFEVLFSIAFWRHWKGVNA